MKPLTTKPEPVYVRPGTRAEKMARKNPAKEIRYVRTPVRARSIAGFLSGLPIVFDSGKARNLDLTLHFQFTGKEDRLATVHVIKGKLAVLEGHEGKAGLTVRVDADTWVGIVNKSISVWRALILGRLRFRGNLLILKRFQACVE